jgi:hypothetical protein
MQRGQALQWLLGGYLVAVSHPLPLCHDWTWVVDPSPSFSL